VAVKLPEAPGYTLEELLDEEWLPESAVDGSTR
jgi:hypothetical protein